MGNTKNEEKMIVNAGTVVLSISTYETRPADIRAEKTRNNNYYTID